MGVDLKWMRTGVALKANVVANLPVKGAVTVDPADSKLAVRMELFNEASNVTESHLIMQTGNVEYRYHG
jgi:hypothetical protein